MDNEILRTICEVLGALVIPTLIVHWLLNYVLARLDSMQEHMKEIAESLAKILTVVEEGRK